MSAPRILDLFSCAGGAGMGYYRAGFDVYSVDIDPQPHNPFPFYQGDALDVLRTLLAGGAITFSNGETLSLSDFAAIHASPPCQDYTEAQRIQGNTHPRLIAPTRELLQELGVPWVIENVVGAPLRDPIMLCGAMFGLETYRHRLFESNVSLVAPEHPEHVAKQTKMGRPPVAGEFMHVVGNFSGVAKAREVMGMPWATRDELREAIPPVYSEYVGKQLLQRPIRATAIEAAAKAMCLSSYPGRTIDEQTSATTELWQRLTNEATIAVDAILPIVFKSGWDAAQGRDVHVLAEKLQQADLNEPIPYKGALGLRTVPAELQARIEAAL